MTRKPYQRRSRGGKWCWMYKRSYRKCCSLKYHKQDYIKTAWKVSVWGVILVSNFPHFDWILTRITPNTDTFLRSASVNEAYCKDKIYWWRFRENNNDFYPWSILAKKLHHRYLTLFIQILECFSRLVSHSLNVLLHRENIYIFTT